MRDELARNVFPVLLHGLKLKERLNRGERPNFALEQSTLKGLLGSPHQPQPWGSGGDTDSSGDHHRFLGVRYALTCWLDEIFIDSPWRREWDENKLEQVLFQTNIRYSNFWAQARIAESMPGSADAQEAFLFCVLLGFRGEVSMDGGIGPQTITDSARAGTNVFVAGTAVFGAADRKGRIAELRAKATLRG